MAKTGAKIIKFEGKENYGEDKYLGFREITAWRWICGRNPAERLFTFLL